MKLLEKRSVAAIVMVLAVGMYIYLKYSKHGANQQTQDFFDSRFHDTSSLIFTFAKLRNARVRVLFL